MAGLCRDLLHRGSRKAIERLAACKREFVSGFRRFFIRIKLSFIEHMRAIATLLTLVCLAGPMVPKQPNQAAESTTSFLSSVTVPKGSTGEDVVCILCSGNVQGHLTGDLVLIGGNADVSGTVDGDVVAVGGWIRNRGSIGGEAFALGGSIERAAGSQIKGEVESAPWFHLPGQRSFHPAGVLCLVAVVLLLVVITSLIWRREKSDRLADRLIHRWWLALVIGCGVWFLYFDYLDEFETGSKVLGILLLVLLLILAIATWFGAFGIAWAVGRLVSRNGSSWKIRLAGGLILSAALLVPVLGLVVICLMLTVGLGAGLLFTWPALRTRKPVAIEPSAPGIP